MENYSYPNQNTGTDFQDGISTKPKRKSFWKVFVPLLILVGLFIFAFSLFAPPKNLKTPSFFRITYGDTLSQVATKLQDGHYIRSKELFRTIMILSHGDRTIMAGDYYFDQPIGVMTIAYRVARGDFNVAQKKITLPEGFTNKEMAETLAKQLPNISIDTFLQLTKEEEGYLFPDTYFFSPISTTEEVVQRLRENFATQTLPLKAEIEKSTHSLNAIVIMASIVEKEAGANDDRAIIAGILWKRIADGMPLQVDAPFLYLLGKKSSDLTLHDLKIDSPYNTYIYKGLPPTPIDNPGLVALTATVSPKDSPYYFYLHGKDGLIHYAKTFEEHKRNKAKYLK